MPTYPAPQPLPVAVDVPFGNLHVVASDRDDVVVTVLPTDPSKSGSVRAAEDVRVDRDGDAVTITYPGSWKQYVKPFSAGTANITIELPAGSELRGKTGSLFAEGRLRTVEMALNGGDVRLDDVDRLDLKVSAGNVVVRRATGAASIKVSAGSLHLDEVAGDATVKVSNGTTAVGSVTGALEVLGAHGDITVSHLRGTLTARAAHAGLRVNNVQSGAATLTTSFGGIEVGVPEGTAAYLEASSEHGSVRNQLTPTEGPVEDEATAEIRATTSYGDVVVRRP